MKRITRIMAGVLCTVLTASAIASCGKTGPVNEEGKTIIEVSDWPTWESGIKKYDTYLATFNEKYGNDFAITQNTWVYDYQTFLMKAASGKLPTVFGSAFTEADRMKNSGYGADITDKLKEYDLLERMDSRVRDIVSKDNKVYSVPTEAYLLGIVFNANLFEEAGLKNKDGTYQFPKTWEELAQTAKIIKDKTGKAGFLLQALDASGGWLFTNIAWAYGVKFVEQDNNGKWVATFDSQECYDALQYMSDLKWKYNVLPENYLLSQQQALEFLATDQVAMIIDGASLNAKTCVSKYNMNIDGVGAFAMPAGPKRRVALLGGKIVAVSADANEKQIDGAFKWWTVTGELPTVELTEEYKQAKVATLEANVSDGIPVGCQGFSPWSGVESTQYNKDIIEKYRNVPKELYEDYNESMEIDGGMEFESEVPVCCQDLYTLLTSVLQTIYTDENADIPSLVKEAQDKWQKDYLDKQANK